MGSTQVTLKPKKQGFGNMIRKHWQLMLMSIPMLLWVVLFSYTPLLGWSLAFFNFRPMFGLTPIQNLFNSEFVGLENFHTLLDQSSLMGQDFIQSVINTLGQSILTLTIGTVFAIGLSLLLHEVRQALVKRFIQNLLYLPHFLSWVIVAMLASMALALPQSGGIINNILLTLGLIREPIHFLANPEYFWGIVAWTHLWKNLGWNTIIYMAAMTAISPTLYEAASIDGASRYSKMWHVTLASIKPTIVILLIMNIGFLLSSGFEIQFFLGSGINRSRAENLDIFILRYGIQMGNFSLATAAGVLRTVVSVVMLLSANLVAKLLKQESLF